VFRAHDGRPHWGKLHTLRAAELETRYPRWSDFRALHERLDPAGRFLNRHLRAVLGGSSGGGSGVRRIDA
jgi:FAD/FMN-containing dehydrogenase